VAPADDEPRQRFARRRGIDVFRYQPRHWNGRKRTASSATTARYLLFPADGDGRTAAAVFRPARCRVASGGFRDWKPSLFATAPFQLQPDEASDHSPVSDYLLVDREKLIAPEFEDGCARHGVAAAILAGSVGGLAIL
jgi:hypothetical protein